MSRTKDATSKKRKLADIDHGGAVLASQERPPKAHKFLKENLSNTPSTASVPVQDLKGGRVDVVSELGSKNRKHNHNPRKSDGVASDIAEIRKDHFRVAEDASGGEAMDHLRQAKPGDKAASRQARSERRSKKKRKPDLTATALATESSPPPESFVSITNATDQTQEQGEHRLSEHAAQYPSEPELKQRFIVFIGNLPYTASTSAIHQHFSKLAPFAVRHSTDRSTGRSRGFAFLEFEGYDRMKTCLKLYHHSLFDVGGEPTSGTGGKKSQARKINVELTAGGGGPKSTARKERIRGKNEKLEGERERARAYREKEEAVAERKKRTMMKAGGNKTGPNTVELVSRGSGSDGDSSIHPSRRRRLKNV